MKPKLGIPGATGAIVAADQLFVAPFVYLPTFLAIKMWSENLWGTTDTFKVYYTGVQPTGEQNAGAINRY